jgi:predicted nucleotidyltransferase
MNLSEHALSTARRVIDQESERRSHVVVALSGAHAYGFPSPDSDLDLKAIHVEPTTRWLGLARPKESAERMEVIDGVEIDYSTNEIQPVLVGILGGNGNFIERVLGSILLARSPELDSLGSLVKRAISRRVYRHYHGFATSQFKDLQKAERPTAKKVLYVLRTALTGAHMLESGEVVTDLSNLIDEYGFSPARELIERKRAGERVPLPEDVAKRWKKELGRAFEALDASEGRSPLPAEAARADLEQWLIELRRARL